MTLASAPGVPIEPTTIGVPISRMTRIAVRNVRRDANEELKKAEKDHVISQDEEKKLHAEVQKFTDEAIKRIDDALHAKEQEIMQV